MKNLFDKEPFEIDTEFDEEAGLFEEFDEEQSDTLLEFDGRPELSEPETDNVLQTEVDRRSKTYIRWIQSSLNRILGVRLAVDGFMGQKTRSAIRSFQRQQGLKVDVIVGLQTEQALITAGASPPPGTGGARPATATLADIDSFSRRSVRAFIAAGRKIDCADLAIELWIRFGKQYGIPVSFRIWHTDIRQYRVHRSHHYRSTDAFVRYVQSNLGALGLEKNTYEIPGGHRAAVAGDVFLWEYRHKVTGRRHRWGHTQIVDQVTRGQGSPNTDEIIIAKGSLPPIVPEFELHPATYFYQPRDAEIEGAPHIGRLLGSGPRRFRSFSHLA